MRLFQIYKPYWDEHKRTEKQIASNEIQLHVQLIFMLKCHECGHLIELLLMKAERVSSRLAH